MEIADERKEPHGVERLEEADRSHPDATCENPSVGNAKQVAPEAGQVDAEANDASEDVPVHSIFSRNIKLFVIAMTVMSSVFSPFTNMVYIPALNALARDLAVSPSDINFSVTTYQIMQGIAPLFFGDLADRAGRRPVYLVTFVIYLAANIGLALQRQYSALLGLRALQSTGSSATIAIGNGVIADLYTSAERGGFVGFVSASNQASSNLEENPMHDIDHD